jgi:uncharacterized membrane protein YphA (DoxX/SURF4 family)
MEIAGSHIVVQFLPGALLIAAGVLVLVGFLTPIASLVVGLVEGVAAVFQIINSENADERDWICSLLIAGAAATLTLTGPGGFSLDARIFGPKCFFIPAENSASSRALGSSREKSSQPRN